MGAQVPVHQRTGQVGMMIVTVVQRPDGARCQAAF